MMDYKKYQAPPIFRFDERTWPGKRLTSAPTWCSVDLRDGNQSLVTPMSLEQKLDFFKLLLEIGFKEIEVGFPAASDTEFQFVRTLIERGLIPDDVTIQVLTQSRDAIIRRTIESLQGAKRAVVHLYNSTSPLQREVVFGKSKEEIKELAVFGAKLCQELAPKNFTFEYSPESFSQTEPEYAAEVCNAVLACWEGREVIINLPFTVESELPNVHADMVEYVCSRLHRRNEITVSLHAHNDRGTAVAATELCLLAGADRVEGTLFGNGERTGNADLITLAMNLYSQGIDPKLNFSEIDKAIEIYTAHTALPVHPRHPYAGELVFTAFSGSHQDAIRKGMANMKEKGGHWAVPYLPIDPMDVGRNYDPIIRVNSQSGAAASAYILEANYGISIPKAMQRVFGPMVTALSDSRGAELSPEDIYGLFKDKFINVNAPISLLEWEESHEGEASHVNAAVSQNGERRVVNGRGDGVLEAFCEGLAKTTGIAFDIKHYSQHALETGREARAITYIGISAGDAVVHFGAGVSRNITTSSVRAVCSALNMLLGG